MSIINRRHTNNIYFFKDDDSNWINDHEKILSHTTSYFQHTSKRSMNIQTGIISSLSPTTFCYVELSTLGRSLFMKYLRLYGLLNLLRPQGLMASAPSFIKDTATLLKTPYYIFIIKVLII